LRRHSKASSVGSTQRQATGLGRIFRGAFATRGASLGSEGSGVPSRRLPGSLAILTVSLTLAACLVPGSALAVETRPPIESFGSEGTSGTKKFEFPSALAFDQSNKRLYALDQIAAFSSEPGSVFGFDTSAPGTYTSLGGEFPLAVGASGEVPDLAVDSASHDFYYLSEEGSLYGFDSGGNALGGKFPLTGFSLPCGAAIDPSGNIWVGEYGTQAVKEYDAFGNPIATVNVSAQGNPCHVALDSEAKLYVAFYGGAIWRYSAASSYTHATEVDPTPSAALTVDRTTDILYVVHSNHVSAYDSTGAFLYEFGGGVSGANFTGIAVNQATDEVYVSDASNGVVHVFGPPVPLPGVLTEDADSVVTTTATLHGVVTPNGDQLTDCHFDFVPASQFEVDQFQSVTPAEQVPCAPAAASIPPDLTGHAVKADVNGLSPGTTYHFRLVAATANGTAEASNRVLTAAIGPPVISVQSVEAVGTFDATVSAKINPQGAKTTYHVEYGPTVSYGQSSAESAPIGFSTDNSAHTVSVHVGGLEPGTAYHFRFVATSVAGNDEGPDVSFATYALSPAFDPCANDPFRSGFGAHLPDCRAYEQATPVDKNGANVQSDINSIQASSAGDRITFYVTSGLPTTGGSSNLAAFMASRSDTGWNSDGLLPTTDPGFQEAYVMGWSDDLSTTAATAPGPGDVGTTIFLRDSGTASFQQTGILGPSPLEAKVAGFAADTSHLIFETRASLAPGAIPNEDNLYDLDHGTLTLPGRIPSLPATSCDDVTGPACIPAPDGSFAGPYAWQSLNIAFGGAETSYYTQNTISRNGSRVFFTAAGSGRLYVRENATTTTQISASQRTIPDPNGEKPAAFMAATPDGSKVFFTSCEKLTDDSTAVSTAADTCTTENQGQDLYSYDVGSGDLIDLTVDPNAGDPKGAAVQGVLGASNDGSYIYFVANGALAQGVSSGNCTIGAAGGANCNLYVFHDGVTTFIAPVGGGRTEREDWAPLTKDVTSQIKHSRVAADGSAVLFSSQQSLTGYDNTEPALGVCDNSAQLSPCTELFRYRAPSKELTCVSCNPTGVPPSGTAQLGTERINFFHVRPRSTFLTRNLSADGNRAFFDSQDALLPTDTNGVNDVYEWEAKGAGSCESESQNGGCLYLLSSGTSPDPSYFGDASADGDHAFLFSDQQLVPSDHDQLYDVYDAGVGAGLAFQHALAPPTCTSTACQANPPPPPEQTPASAAFQGPGNVHEGLKARGCPKGKRKVRRAGKVRCQKQSKQHKRHNNRGGAK
jgi:hypothetical protein